MILPPFFIVQIVLEFGRSFIYGVMGIFIYIHKFGINNDIVPFV